MLQLLIKVLVLAFNIAVFLVEIVLWRLYLLSRLYVTVRDYLAARKTLTPSGKLTCPQGHAFEIENVRCRCGSCSFEYIGSPLWCENVECKARAASFVNCSVCGLSVRSPYRWGRP